MEYEYVKTARDEQFTTITMNRPDKRNALSERHMQELRFAFNEAGETETSGIILAGSGPVFSAGHDFSEMAGSDISFARRLFSLCTELMATIQSVPQPVIARVHGLATAAGCQLVASCDLAVAGRSAGFAAPGGKGGLFCHTPMVAISRNVGRKRAFEMAFTGDVVDAMTAAEWGFINYAVDDADLVDATNGLLERATRGSRYSKALGKSILYRQLSVGEDAAYALAVEAMAGATQSKDAQEGITAFLEKRRPKWVES